MSNFNSATGLLGTVVVAGTSLIALKLTTDFIGSAIKNTQKSIPKSNKRKGRKSKKQNYFGFVDPDLYY